MMKTKRTLWQALIALAALAFFGFGIAACDSASPTNNPGDSQGSGDKKTLSGDITISPSETDAINTPLTATYSGTEEVSLQWRKNGSLEGTAVTGKTSTYTPTEEASYQVTVSASGYESKTSNAVTVASLGKEETDGATGLIYQKSGGVYTSNA